MRGYLATNGVHKRLRERDGSDARVLGSLLSSFLEVLLFYYEGNGEL